MRTLRGDSQSIKFPRVMTFNTITKDIIYDQVLYF